MEFINRDDPFIKCMNITNNNRDWQGGSDSRDANINKMNYD